MNKNLLILFAGATVLGGALYYNFLHTSSNPSESVASDTTCLTACHTAADTCPSLIDEGACTAKCANLNEETVEHLVNASTCEELTARPDLISEILIPELPDTEAFTETNPTTNDCEAACGNYVTSCLSLVPNASESVLNDGYTSCLDECSTWETPKIECMLSTFDCVAMTEVCGL